MMFKPATKKQSKLRLAISGPSGSGKTYSALSIASALGKRIAVIDTEHGSASLYADKFSFDTLDLDSFSPETYVAAIEAANEAKYDVLVIDSLSHAWMGKDGALEQVDTAAKKSGSKNSYFAWRDVTPKHNALVEAMLQSNAHIIATMRSKTEYSTDKDDKGKVTPKKIGLAPIQREGMEYEFTVFGELDLDHNLNITKSRCSAIAGKLVEKPGKQLADVLKAWLETGAPAEAPKPKLVLAEAETDVDDSRAQSPLTVVSGLIANAKRVRELEAVKPRIQELDAFLREQAIPQYNERLKVLVAENEALKKAPQTAKPDEKAAEPSAATPPVSDKKIAEPSTPFDDPEAGRPDAPAVHERQPGDDTEEVKAELTQAQKDEADAKALSDDLEKATTVTEINALAPRFKLLTAAMQAQLRKPFSSRKADLTKAGKL